MTESKKALRAKKIMPDTFHAVPAENLNRALFKKNLAAIARRQPEIADKLKALKETYATLMVNDAGQYDIHFRGAALQDAGHLDWAEQRMDKFHVRGGLKRLQMAPIDSANLDDESNLASYRMMKRAVDADIHFLNAPNTLEAYHVIAFGIGLGFHLNRLAEVTRCRHLLLVEPNLEFLYWSCYLFDWTAFYREARRHHREVVIINVTDPTRIMELCIGYVRLDNPAFVDGLLLFQSYQSSLMHAAQENIIKNRDLFNIGLGFLEDEIDMIRNSYRNLKNFTGKYYATHEEELIPHPVFVIGSGPSLDNDLKFIRDNADKAIVVSCGTVLRVLLRNGIVPDFQMEMENVPAVTELMRALSKDYDLSSIKLVASNTVDPGVAPHFEQVVYYIRTGISSSPIFSVAPKCGIPYSTPTVTNLGFSFAQEFGAREIYLFGVDLGARNPEKHHASDAPYNDGELEFTTTINVPTPGNFGGEVQSEKIYLWSKNTLELAMKRFPLRMYVNCSDGVHIKGALPKLSSSVLLGPSTDKKATVDAIWSRFPAYTPELFEWSWNRYDLRRELKKVAGNILRKCYKSTLAARRNENTHDLEFTFKVIHTFITGEDGESAEIHYLRGSGLMFLSLVTYYYSRVPTPEKRAVYAEIARDEFSHLVRTIRDTMLEFYDYLEEKIEQDGKYETRPQ
ncbi:6-hydroxymethylpterin diphosphokinase MptE-like protein [Varunaivibrio sulfuroxidans]|uniref:DUF115 domain-containing protein n=1 Tax=Varunaivibrio sulfuroxidans TaxID=1773489 RepID=A0A4R3JBH6_9PROT|nr:6-hydroxymethylpterin diphosphokinase MptE-like protein [Varunaivibrio sulfuroxidans]TCS62984.1 hypothetical protein EDD55_10475 [Varunaivibrio sulfuroxidans]WES31938.1 DUF115 domain-containing protein [Varunaivibrio sulfuroxidans]